MEARRVGAVVLACSCVLLAGIGLRGQTKKAAAPQEAQAKATQAGRNKPGPVGTTNVHVFPDDCRSQEPMVHADAKGKVTFHNMSQTTKLKLTFTTKTVFKNSNPVDLDPGKSEDREVNDLPQGVNEIFTQYEINTCGKPPFNVNVKAKKRGSGSDPNDITVP